MAYLPRECAYRIFSFLADEDLEVTKRVSRGFYEASSAMRTEFDLRTEPKDVFQRETVIGKTDRMRISLDRFRGVPDTSHRPIAGFPNRYVSEVHISGATDDIHKCDLTFLRRLEIEPFVYKSVTLNGIDSIIASCSFLETLVIPRVRLNNDAVRALKGLGNLKRLGISDAKVDPIDAVEFPVSLTELDTSFCRYAGFSKNNIPSLVNLRRLNAMDMILSAIEIDRLFALTNLEHLDVSWNGSGPFLRRIGTLGSLRRFEAAVIGNLGCDGQLSYLGALSYLNHLNLENCDIRSEHLEWIKASRSITYLNLSYNYVGSLGVEYICENGQYEHLDLSYNQVCDRGAEVLAASRMPGLRHLDLACNYITSAGARELADTRVRFLDLTQNLVPCAVVAEILDTSGIPELTVGTQRSSP